MSLRKLGRVQTALLSALEDHGAWTDHPTSNWYWRSRSKTRDVLRALERRRLVSRTRTCDGYDTYRLRIHKNTYRTWDEAAFWNSQGD